jgi:serine/threonine protein kinase
MRCLQCETEGIPTETQVCPTCGVYLPSLLREILPPGMRLHGGTYRIEHALARGGFGIIYRSLHIALNHLVAIKEFYPQEYAFRELNLLRAYPLRKETFWAGVKQFTLEGRILVKLNHPKIVSVRDLFMEHGTAYLVMEFINGRSLKRILDEQPGHRLPTTQVMAIVEQLVEALEFLHQMDVYHLDIKPENILVMNTGQVVLIDFGAARQRQGKPIAPQFTLEYAAPEVLNKGDIGPQSDIFELAMTTHELLTGVRPPPAMERMLDRPWPMTDLDQPWYDLLTWALQLSKDQRPTSVRRWWLYKSVVK